MDRCDRCFAVAAVDDGATATVAGAPTLSLSTVKSVLSRVLQLLVTLLALTLLPPVLMLAPP